MDDIPRAGEGGVGRGAVADLVHETLVVQASVEHDGRAVRQQVGRPGHRRKRFVVDSDPFGRVLRPVEGLGEDKDDAVADMARMAVRKREIGRARRRFAAAPLHRRSDMGNRAEPVGDVVARGQDGGDARHGGGRGNVDFGEPRIGVRRPQDVAVQRPLEARSGIVRKLASAGQQRRILKTRNGLPYAEFAHRTVPCFTGSGRDQRSGSRMLA